MPSPVLVEEFQTILLEDYGVVLTSEKAKETLSAWTKYADKLCIITKKIQQANNDHYEAQLPTPSK